MATFRVGQRVRILRSASGRWDGKEAVVWAIIEDAKWVPGSGIDGETAYRVDVYGVRHSSGGFWLSFPAEWLTPITDDKRWATQRVEELKLLGTKPVIKEEETV